MPIPKEQLMTGQYMLSRRAFLGLSIATLSEFSLACQPGTDTQNTQEKLRSLREENKSRIPILKDKPLMLDQFFNRLNFSLKQSPSFFLQMTADYMKQAWISENNPSAFPAWISEYSTPIAITKDEGPRSLSTIKVNFDGPIRFKQTVPAGKEYYFQKPGSAILGMNLGLNLDLIPPEKANNNQIDLMQGFYLAKEWINTVGHISTVNNFVSIFEKEGHKFVLLDTNQPVSKEDIPYVGLAVYYQSIAVGTSDLWKLLDGLPIALLAIQIEKLVQSGSLPNTSRLMSGFYVIANMLNKLENTEVKNTLNDFIDRWIKSGNMIPPPDYLSLILNPKIELFIEDLQKVIVKYQ